MTVGTPISASDAEAYFKADFIKQETLRQMSAEKNNEAAENTRLEKITNAKEEVLTAVNTSKIEDSDGENSIALEDENSIAESEPTGKSGSEELPAEDLTPENSTAENSAVKDSSIEFPITKNPIFEIPSTENSSVENSAIEQSSPNEPAKPLTPRFSILKPVPISRPILPPRIYIRISSSSTLPAPPTGGTALETREIYRCQKLATAVYRSELLKEMIGINYEMRIYEKTGAPEIASISRAYIEASSPRQTEIMHITHEVEQ